MIINGPSEFLPTAFYSYFPTKMSEIDALNFIRNGFKAPLDFELPENVKKDLRDMLRHHGFKPTGRNKPASEYLRKALADKRLSPRVGINAAVDVCNVSSLHSGLPISVVDSTKIVGEIAIKPLEIGTTYPFNPTGQLSLIHI